MGGAAAPLLLAIAAVLATTPGTFALWNQAASIPEATVATGTLAATIAIGAETGTAVPVPAESFSGMLPGEVRAVTLTVRNTGTTPLVVAASLDEVTADDANVSFGIVSGACLPAPTLGTTLTTVPLAVGDRLLRDQSAPFCLIVRLSPTVPATAQGTTVIPQFILTLTAQQATA